MGHSPTRPQVMAYFAARPGEHCFLENIVKETKLNHGQVRGAINNMIAANRRGELEFPLEVVQKGQIWVHRPKAEEASSTVSKVYEQLGITKAGEIIIQDETGVLYKAQEL